MVGSIRSEIAQSQDKCMPWTNEKHNRYLDYLEASFVRKLHSRMDSLTRCTDHTETSEEVSLVPYMQCQKIKFGKDRPHPYTVFQCKNHVRHAVKDSSTDLQELPRDRSQDINMKRIKSNCYKRSSLEDSYLTRFCHHSTDPSVVECTDQNFVDDVYQKLSPNASGAKKLKITACKDTPNGGDQQIPFVELYSSNKSVLGYSSSLKEEGGKT